MNQPFVVDVREINNGKKPAIVKILKYPTDALPVCFVYRVDKRFAPFQLEFEIVVCRVRGVLGLNGLHLFGRSKREFYCFLIHSGPPY